MNDVLFVVSTDSFAAEQIARPLRDRGWAVETEASEPAMACWRIHECAPAAVVISLAINPFAACDLACALTVAVSTRDIPIVFAGGSAEDRATALGLRPDAVAVDIHDVPWAIKRLSLGN
ncbi:MAG: hypothetical protein CVT60_06775 [Actinobacteria bacterium HGW-Actinobacteria-10]|nr:MAG: hypothetical protein CVT60_06775 [Actinobacteria bacterium HGW-Actinobacteria-10]